MKKIQSSYRLTETARFSFKIYLDGDDYVTDYFDLENAKMMVAALKDDELVFEALFTDENGEIKEVVGTYTPACVELSREIRK